MAARQVERPNRRAGEPQDRHGDDFARHQLGPRERGRLFGAVHGVGNCYCGGQAHGHHLADGFSRAVRHRLVDVGRRGRHPGLRLHHLPLRVAQPVRIQHENHPANNKPISKYTLFLLLKIISGCIDLLQNLKYLKKQIEL